MLSKNHLINVCLLNINNYAGGDSNTCRYLRQDEKDWDKWYCLKHKAADKTMIDAKISMWEESCRNKGKDPTASGIPLGDNCKGYPLLKNIKQGYDV